ncbi:phosphate signaling complex protein PhoU [bacterium]|nr:phosphate signaling complex protein PhoU [bacterium]
MTTHFQREIDAIKRELLALGGLVEETLWKAVQAFNERDESLADEVVETDREIDRREVQMEEECLKVLALHQPVAVDLRLIVAVLKINNDLERIGDLSVNIARRARFLASHPQVRAPFDLPGMARQAQAMLHDSLDAVVNMDTALARRVCEADDEIDAVHRQTFGLVRDEIRAHPDQLDALTHILSTSNHLERIGDLATNIAEDVIYLVEGRIVRHRSKV